jgi:hypothetical protein
MIDLIFQLSLVIYIILIYAFLISEENFITLYIFSKIKSEYRLNLTLL